VSLGALGRFQLFDAGGIVAIAGLAAAFVVGVTRNTVALARLEPPRDRRAASSTVAGSAPAAPPRPAH
jgi:hypothetical protein